MGTSRDRWQQLISEPTLDPDLPICDAHHHLNPDDRYLLNDFLHDTQSGHKIVSTVYIECRAMYRKDGPQEMKPIGETEFADEIAIKCATGQYGPTAVAAGIVGYADLRLGTRVASVLEGHLAASPNHFRGIRYICTWDASPDVKTFPLPGAPRGLMLDATFRAGFGTLKKYGLSFDAWLYYPQLPELVSLAQAFPDVPIIVNHVGGILGIGPYAGRRDEVFQAWKHGMAKLATCPQVVIKLGGLGIPRSGFGWDNGITPATSAELAKATAPYYLSCIELFEPNRCMFESNFPVDKQSYSYCIEWNSFKQITQDLSPSERAALFHDTASRVYRLTSSTAG